MNTLELIQALKDATDITKFEAAAVVDIFFNGMAGELAKRKRVEIRGLCSFFVKEYDGYTGRNPKTGERVKIAPKKLPFFKAGKELKERVNADFKKWRQNARPPKKLSCGNRDTGCMGRHGCLSAC